MQELKRTSAAGDHYHIAFLDDATGQGFITAADGHTHQCVRQQIPGMQTDPATGQPVQVMVPGPWVIAPDVDGHSHELQDYEIEEMKSGQTDEEIISECAALFKSATEYEDESVKSGRESEAFYMGEGQWDPVIRRKLESSSRACLTINKTQKEIDNLCGHQRQLRTDLRYLPVGDGDQKIADILNILSKHALEQCYYEREESAVFEDQVIPGRGIFNLYVDFTKELTGDPKVEHFTWDQVAFGPHDKMDLSDCEHLTKHRMFSVGKIKAVWKKKAEDVETNYKEYVDLKNEGSQLSGDEYSSPAGRVPSMVGTYKTVDIARKEMRVMECWRRLYLESALAYVGATEKQFSLFGWKSEDKEAVKTIPGLFVIDKDIVKMRITRYCGGVVLSDEYPADLPEDDFFVVPVYGHKRGCKFWGKVEIAKDPQREINKRTSQAIDIGNRMAAYGWFIDQNTFVKPEDKEDFKRNSSTPGFVQEVADSTQPPKMVEGTKFPSEIVNLIQMSFQNITELMNISIVPVEGDSPGAILQQQRLRLVGNEYLFDNLSFAKKKIGRLLVAIFQKHYSPDRIFRILSNADSKSPVTIGGQSFQDIPREELISLLQTMDLSKYDVVASESTWSPSERIAVMMLLKDMDAPLEVVIPMADIPEEKKREILAGIQQQQAAAQSETDKKAEAEVQKSLIAQGLFPPKVLEQQGLTQPQGQPAPGVAPPQPQQGVNGLGM